MFDTIHFAQSWRITNKHEDWSFQQRGSMDAETFRALDKFHVKGTHKSNTIRVYGPSLDVITKVYVSSLATMLHGDNTRSLSTPAEVAAALDILDGFLRQFGSRLSDRRFVRVDIAANLPNVPFREIESALQLAKLPGSRLPTKRYVGQSIEFSRNLTELAFYDKIKCLIDKHGSGLAEIDEMTRCELRLSGKDLERELGGGKPVQELEFNVAYHALRRHALSLSGDVPYGVNDLESFLAFVGKTHPQHFELYLDRCVSSHRRKELRRNVGRKMSLVGDKPIPWQQYFPELPPENSMPILALKDVELPHFRLINAARERWNLDAEPTVYSSAAQPL